MFVKERKVQLDTNAKMAADSGDIEKIRNEEVTGGVDNEEDGHGHSNEEEGRVTHGGDSILFPGSPSFRDYFVIDPCEGKNSGACTGAKIDDKLHCHEGSRTRSRTKWRRKGRRIRNVLNRGGPSRS
ncbi:hypothetical protein CFOL_v3_32208 [Cephalotus follicularis]|uniref:Uncharacterized protein n=1 Tax=Cephalotus follicularis TaxID=3775 RepID=A0A1Q3D8G2_CEPFO|nr:hypothetical protein CFOL_v3_32208 [Cephalotus follicularis]